MAKKKTAKYKQLEDLENEITDDTQINDELWIICVSCSDRFNPIRDVSMTVRCPNCGFTNKIPKK